MKQYYTLDVDASVALLLDPKTYEHV